MNYRKSIVHIFKYNLYIDQLVVKMKCEIGKYIFSLYIYLKLNLEVGLYISLLLNITKFYPEMRFPKIFMNSLFMNFMTGVTCRVIIFHFDIILRHV